MPELHVERVPSRTFHVLDDKDRLIVLIQGDQLRPKELSIGEAETFARLFAVTGDSGERLRETAEKTERLTRLTLEIDFDTFGFDSRNN